MHMIISNKSILLVIPTVRAQFKAGLKGNKRGHLQVQCRYQNRLSSKSSFILLTLQESTYFSEAAALTIGWYEETSNDLCSIQKEVDTGKKLNFA